MKDLLLFLILCLALTNGVNAADDDCLPEVREKIVNDSINHINNTTDLIEAELGRPANFTNISCIDRILNTGVEGFFSPPNFSEILDILANAAENFACSQADSYYNESVGKINRDLRSLTKLPETNGFIPSVITNQLSGSLNPRISRGNASGIENINDRFDDLDPDDLENSLKENFKQDGLEINKSIQDINDAAKKSEGLNWLYK